MRKKQGAKPQKVRRPAKVWVWAPRGPIPKAAQVPKSTLSNRARTIREALHLGPLDIEFCRREILERHPMAWMISVNGFIVDARTMPPEIQAVARRKGLIPDLPIPQSENTERLGL